MNIVVILAGGVGKRLSMEKPKQFLKVAGKTVIEHTVDVFQKHAAIDEIAIVMNKSYVHDMDDMVLKNRWTKVKKILTGGSERYESSLAAIRAYSVNCDDNTNIIFHDAVRPLVSKKTIFDVIEAMKNYRAVDVAIPAVDTIIKVNSDKSIVDSIPTRDFLYRGQTPQAFKLGDIRKAYELALEDPNFTTTDDCGILIKYLPDVKVHVVLGAESNIKLTYPEDIYLLDKLFQLKSEKINESIDLKQLKDKVIVVFGGNSGIGKEMVEQAKHYGAKAYAFSRSLNGVDITDLDSIKKALASVYAIEGKINYVVNSAAVLNKEPILHLLPEKIASIIDINFKGMVNTSVAGYEYLKKTQGQVLQFTSSSYTKGRAFYCLYSSTKSAAVNFVQALAEEWEDAKIQVNCINPQRTRTPMRTANFGIEEESTLLKSEDVAEIALKTLLSDFTGEVVDIKVK